MRIPKSAANLSALLLVLALATVLITPDPTDDVHGVVRSHRMLHTAVVAIASPSLLILHFANEADRSQSSQPTTSDLLKLLCTCRC